jgi:hypothetical protein
MPEQTTQREKRHWLDVTSLLVSLGALIVSLLSYVSSNRSIAVAEEANRNTAQQNAQYVNLQIRDIVSSGGIDKELSVINVTKSPAYNVWIDIRDYEIGTDTRWTGSNYDSSVSHVLHLGIVEPCTEASVGTVSLGHQSKGIYGFVHYTDPVGRQWVRGHNGGQPAPDDGKSWPRTFPPFDYPIQEKPKRSTISSC